MLIVVLLPLLYSPVWFAASLYDTVWIGFVSKALLVLFICLTLLFRSSPKSSSGPFVTFFANCFIQPGNFGLIMFLLNWLVGLAACARKARAFISGVRNSLLRSILYLTNHPITILAIFLLKGASSFFLKIISLIYYHAIFHYSKVYCYFLPEFLCIIPESLRLNFADQEWCIPPRKLLRDACQKALWQKNFHHHLIFIIIFHFRYFHVFLPYHSLKLKEIRIIQANFKKMGVVNLTIYIRAVGSKYMTAL